MAGAMGAGAAVSMAVAAVDSMEAEVADSTAVAAHMAVAHSAEVRAVDIRSAAVADLSAVSGAARAADDRLAAEDLLAGDDQGRLVFAVAHLVARVDSLRVRAVRSEMAGRVPTASME